ncbi:helix-turn-helix domain-containing protein [Pseudactinotalea sp.]|uniref:helix-turn-helix domain-containing protein n=1 Tax=Pseudactinotalea sp. TaxID=1926260 RepID=UPI003B3B2FC6
MSELTTAQLRVLAHPMRLALLRRLRAAGAATARGLGREFDIDSGAASYHLRQLAEGGLIVEDAERGTRRERWWRAVDPVSQFAASEHRNDDDTSREYMRAVVLSKADELQRVASAVALEPREWLEAQLFSDHTLHLDVAGMEALKGELLAVVHRYADYLPVDPSGARAVAAHLELYPRS